MLADNDAHAGQESTNGASRGASNGSGPPHQRLPVASSTNGTHKAGPDSINGSQNGKAPEHEDPPANYFGHDREEVTRILIQALSDMGYHTAAESVGRDSGFELESPTVASFRQAVLEGAWSQAEQLLFGAEEDEAPRGSGLVLAPGADPNLMRFWLRQQKFLELLEQRETTEALMVLRGELSTLHPDAPKLHFLSSLLMCQTAEELKAKAEWDGALGQSRHILLSELSRCISPSVMLPEHRLAVLLEQVKESQINNCLYHTTAMSPSLYADHTCDRNRFPSEVIAELEKHAGEVWQVRFSHDGTRLASCGSDRLVFIWDVTSTSFDIVHRLDAHEGGVGNLAWSPDDTKLVTCGRDRYAKVWDAQTGTCLKVLERFEEPISCCVWAADCRTFITGSFDLERSLCQWSLDGTRLYTWSKRHRTEDLAVSQDGHWLVAMDDQSHLHVYNFVTRELEYEMELKSRPTSVSISQDSRFILVNKVDGEIQLIDIVSREPIQKYTGSTGGEFLIRSDFGGANESFVISGSEDGFVSIWHKSTGIVVQKVDGHHPRCNAACWNPEDPTMFASCGDDGKIKIWSNKERLRSQAFKLPSNGSGRNSNGWRSTEQLGEA